MAHLTDRKSEIDRHKKTVLGWIRRTAEAGELQSIKELYSFIELKSTHAALSSGYVRRHEGYVLLDLLKEEEEGLKEHIPVIEAAIQNMEKFLNQDEETLSQFLVYLFKKYIVTRAHAVMVRPEVGWASTNPSEYTRLNTFQRRAATINIDRSARIYYIIKLLYNGVPYELLNNELRPYLLPPSLYEFTQRDGAPLEEDIFGFLGTPADPDTARSKDIMHVKITQYMEKIEVLQRDVKSDPFEKLMAREPQEIPEKKKKPQKLQGKKKKTPKQKEAPQSGSIKVEPVKADQQLLEPSVADIASTAEIPAHEKIAAILRTENYGGERPKQYKPINEGLSTRAFRVQGMIEAAKEERVPILLRTLKPRNTIELEKDVANTYKRLNGEEGGTVIWREFVTLMTKGFGGKIVNVEGSMRWIIIPFLVNQDGKAIESSSRLLHEPHPGKEIGVMLRERIKDYLRYWGLAPDQGFVHLS